MKKKVEAFTLIELVIVIAILAILISIAIPKFQQTNLRAKVTAHNANVRVIKNAAILYFADHPDKNTVNISELEDYIEGAEDLKPVDLPGLENQSYEVSKKEDGKVVVTPGIVKFSDIKKGARK